MNENVADYFGARLRELRSAAGLTQKALGEAVGSSANAIAQYETGRHKPSWEAVVKFAAALGVGVEAFTQLPSDVEKRRPGRPKRDDESA